MSQEVANGGTTSRITPNLVRGKGEELRQWLQRERLGNISRILLSSLDISYLEIVRIFGSKLNIFARWF